MSDVSRKVVPNEGSLNRTTGKPKRAFSSEVERRVRDGVHSERHGDRYGGRVPSKKRKTKAAILKIILSLTGSQ